MRKILIPLAVFGGIALIAMPVAAQHREEDALRGAGQMARQAAPMVDRSMDRALDLDVGPILDALHPYSPQGRRMTLREMGRRDDPQFEQKLQRSIYRGSARLAATLDAMATAAPAMRQSLRQMEAAISGAMVEARRPLPPEAYGPPRDRHDARPSEGDDAPPPPPPPGNDEDDDGAPW
jgi:hypothetical protein